MCESKVSLRKKKRKHHSDHSHIIYLLRKFIWRPVHKDNIHLATRGILITRNKIYIICTKKKGPSRLLSNVFLSFRNLYIRPVKDGQVPNAGNTAVTGSVRLDVYYIQTPSFLVVSYCSVFIETNYYICILYRSEQNNIPR